MLDIAEKQNIRIEIDALSARLGCPVIRWFQPVVAVKRSSWRLIAIANENVELVHYAQPLLNEADSLAK